MSLRMRSCKAAETRGRELGVQGLLLLAMTE